MRGIVDCRENIGIDVIDRLAVQYGFREPERNLVSMPHLVFPSLENLIGFRRWFQAVLNGCQELLVFSRCEAKDSFGEIFVDFFRTCAEFELLSIESGDGFQMKMPFSDKNRS